MEIWNRSFRHHLCRRRRYGNKFEYGEDPEEHITYLAESITAFINALTENEDGEDDEDDLEDDEE
jgi:hypothetical protein